MIRLQDLTPTDPCPRVAAGYEPCGLLWQHPGPCRPFVPGDYLPPPLLHPLDALLADLLGRRCPLCGVVVVQVDADFVTAFRGEQTNWDRPSLETQLTFWPCRCVVRVIDN